jgi:hypothetical protein
MIEIVSFDVYIDDTETTGVEMISLVKKPAIMEDFIAMSDNQTEQYKQVILSEDDKQIITGPALIPDIEIIRKDEDGNPFYIKYSKETIEKIAQKFAKFRGNYQVNKDHKKEKMAEETFIYESWITGENDKALELGFDVPAGTWMVSLKVENSDLWNQIKSGKYKGFSIEGLFKFKRSSRIVKQECDCNHDVELNGEPGLIHPNCRCSIRRGEFRLSKPRTGKDGNPVPCELCKMASESWVNKGFIEDVFGTKYENTKQEKINLGYDEKDLVEKNDFDSNITMSEQVALVKPGESENQDEFISRCMGDKTMNSEYPEQNQRAAVCYAYWSEKQEKINVNMVSAILKDGNTIYTDAESMAVGVEVYFMEGESKVSVDNGEYELEDGNIIVVEESKIKEIKDMSQMNEELSNKNDKETKMEIDPMLVEQFDAIKGMLENLNLKIDSLILGENESAGKVDQIETKLEKLLVDNEMKSIEATDDLKKVAQESHSKRKLDYDLITKYNKKF